MTKKEEMARVVVVSGGTRGIGKALVERFLKENMVVVTCSRQKRHVEALKQSCADKRLHTFVADLSRKEEVDAFAQEVSKRGPCVDVLVNNVGRFLSGTISEAEEHALEMSIATNLYSAYWLTRALLPRMQRKNGASTHPGHIFNVNSVAGLNPYPGGSLYSISKYAMRGFGAALRQELKDQNIRVTDLFPGAVLTDSWRHSSEPESRFMSVEDVAHLVWQTYQSSGRTCVEELVLRPQKGDL